MRKTKHWHDYQLVDAGDGIKIEKFKELLIERPEPQALWKRHTDIKADAVYSNGQWSIKKDTPKECIITYDDMRFQITIDQGKQVRLFPEQAVNWDWMRQVIRKQNHPVRILNLFAYTGGATIACAMENIEEIVHIDALKSANNTARTNIELNHLEDKTIRIIQEDALKFLLREKKRGRTYHGIVMDPPSFGRGPNKEQWKIEDQLHLLLDAAVDILDPHACFLSVNTYTSNLSSASVVKQMNAALVKHNFKAISHSDAIGLTIASTGNSLPCGITTRWSNDENLL